MRSILILLTVWSALAGLTVGASTAGQALSPADAAHRINIAGRQRMLSQRMSKAVCFSILGIDKERQSKIAADAAVEFQGNLHWLLEGDSTDGTLPEAVPEIRVALSEVEALSDPLVRSVLQLAAGDLHTVAMGLVISRNQPTLTRMNQTVGMIEQAHGNGAMSADLANTINQAGRQRMLSQRISKAMCLISAGLNKEDALTEIRNAVELFETTLLGLQNGDAERRLLPPPSARVSVQFAIVQDAWIRLAPLVRRSINGDAISTEDLIMAVHSLDKILVESNRAVSFWVKDAGSG